jgi:hypothetical protein
LSSSSIKITDNITHIVFWSFNFNFHHRLKYSWVASNVEVESPGLRGEASINVSPPGCVEVHVFKTSTGFYGIDLESPPNTCVRIINVTINGHSIPKLDWGCRREVQLNPLFHPYLALEPGSRAVIKLVIVGGTVLEKCLIEVKINAPPTGGNTKSTTSPPQVTRALSTRVYGWLGGTPVRVSQHHRLKALAGSRSVVLLVGSAWLAVVVKRICGP